jgi:arabinofuranan 3-O-arabinosyltransferase
VGPSEEGAVDTRPVGRWHIGSWSTERWWRVGGLLVLAALAYVPALAVRPGVVTPDTKTYLYLDPTKFLSQVPFLWNPTVALGTVTHEYIGYLLPMGPFYLLFHALGVPVWVAQRLWLGSILFVAGAGILYLCRVLGLEGPGPVAAALAYMLSPYFLQYAGRISVILLPWSGLPFLVGLAIVALRRGGWREPALFAVVVACVSGINATSIIYVGVAPLLWILYAVLVLRETTWRHAGATVARIGVLTLGACVWWMAGLEVEAAYGVNVLKFTETVPSTSATSNASEVIRGLGYWYFYGSDHLGAWTNAAIRYTQDVALIAASYAVPVIALVAAAFVRWRERAYFVVLLFVGLVLAVGPFPFTDPTRIGSLLRSFMTNTTAGLALRSTDRAAPVVLLALSMLLACGLSALWRRVHWAGLTTALLVGGLVVANNPSVFNGDTIANNFTQPASLPSYEMAAINHLNGTHPGTRVLAIPGNDFASYRWGDTVDTPQSAFLNRDFVTREQQIMGSIATADTLYALDAPMQDGTANLNALSPMARLMGAGDVMVEYDQRYEHFASPQPQLLARELAQTPQGLSDPVSFGTPRPNEPTVSMLNEQDLAAPANPKWPAPIVDYTVSNPRPLLRGESNTGALVMEGDATGLNNLAGLGMLDTNSALYYAGTLATEPTRLRQLASQDAHLVVTDTNRKEAFRWDTLTANAGFTETPSDNPSKTDLSDSPVELFPHSGVSSRTVATYVGAVNVTASSYGNSVSYTPEDQAYSAIDGNLDTAWITGTFLPDPSGQWWQAQFGHAVTADHVTLVQPQRGNRSRWVSAVTLTFDGKHPERFALTPASHAPTGQTLQFPTRTFHTLRITLDGTTNSHVSPLNASAVGFSEVEVPGQTVRQVIQMPSQMLSTLGAASTADRLSIVMTRQRTSQFPPRDDPESTISRSFSLPSTRSFSLTGSGSLSALIPDDEIDRLVGRTPTASDGGYVASYSSGRLPGDLSATASATLDGNPTTAWQPGLGTSSQLGTTLTYDLSHPVALDHLSMQVIADGRHSVPTSMTITATDAPGSAAGSSASQTRTITLPPIADSTVPGAVTSVPVTFPALVGSQFVITFTGVRDEYAANYYSAGPLALPLGVAEIGMPGVQSPATPARLPGTCVSNLLSIDGHPIDVALVGSTQNALNGGQVQMVPCGPDAHGITLGPGTHVVQTATGHTANCASTPSTCTGWNLDQLVLDSAAGGGTGATPTPTSVGTPQLPATQPGPAPAVTMTASHIDSKTATVTGAKEPFELVLGESVDKGWHATALPGPHAPAGAHAVDLGTSELVDGFANGWQISARDLAALGGSSFTVETTWTPQTLVWGALLISGATILLCLVLGFLPTRSRRWLRARLPRRLRGPAGPDAPERPSAPFDPPMLTIPFVPSGGLPADVEVSDDSGSVGPPSVDQTPDAPVGDASVAETSLTNALLAVTSPSPSSPSSPSSTSITPSDGATTGDGSRLATLDRTEPGELAPSDGAVASRRTARAVGRAVAVGLVTGAIAALVVPLWAALGVAGVVVVGLYVAWVRGLATAGGVALIAAGCASVVYGQEVHRYLSGSNWPGSFARAGNLIWLGVVLLVADAAISAFRLRLPRPLGSRALQSASPVTVTPEPGMTERETTDLESTEVDPALENPAAEGRDEETEGVGQVREEPQPEALAEETTGEGETGDDDEPASPSPEQA